MINKNIEYFSTVTQLGLLHIYKNILPPMVEYTYFSGTCGTFPRIDHNAGH